MVEGLGRHREVNWVATFCFSFFPLEGISNVMAPVWSMGVVRSLKRRVIVCTLSFPISS